MKRFVLLLLVSSVFPLFHIYGQFVISSSAIIPPFSFSGDYSFGSPGVETLLSEAGISETSWLGDSEINLPGGLEFFQMTSLFMALPFYDSEEFARYSFPSGLVVSFSPIYNYGSGPQFILNYRLRAGLSLNLLQLMDVSIGRDDRVILLNINGFHTKHDVTFPEEAPGRLGNIVYSSRTGIGLEIAVPQIISVELNVGYVSINVPEHIEYGGVHAGITIQTAPYVFRLPLTGW